MKILVIEEEAWEAFLMLLFRAYDACSEGDFGCGRRCLVAMYKIINEC